MPLWVARVAQAKTVNQSAETLSGLAGRKDVVATLAYACSLCPVRNGCSDWPCFSPFAQGRSAFSTLRLYAELALLGVAKHHTHLIRCCTSSEMPWPARSRHKTCRRA